MNNRINTIYERYASKNFQIAFDIKYIRIL